MTPFSQLWSPVTFIHQLASIKWCIQKLPVYVSFNLRPYWPLKRQYFFHNSQLFYPYPLIYENVRKSPILIFSPKMLFSCTLNLLKSIKKCFTVLIYSFKSLSSFFYIHFIWICLITGIFHFQMTHFCQPWSLVTFIHQLANIKWCIQKLPMYVSFNLRLYWPLEWPYLFRN